MKIYIASSWKNQHAVEMLTSMLENRGHTVNSFVREAVKTEDYKNMDFDIDKWINSEDGAAKFKYDTESAMNCELVIYISPSGMDAAAECGMAYAKGVPVVGLHAKGENLGLMRRMMDQWYFNYRDIIRAVDTYSRSELILPIHSRQISKNSEIKEDMFFVLNYKRFREIELLNNNPEMDMLKAHPAIKNLIGAFELFRDEYQRLTGKVMNQEYVAVNKDEPYIDKIMKVILQGEDNKLDQKGSL